MSPSIGPPSPMSLSPSPAPGALPPQPPGMMPDQCHSGMEIEQEVITGSGLSARVVAGSALLANDHGRKKRWPSAHAMPEEAAPAVLEETTACCTSEEGATSATQEEGAAPP